MDDIAKTLAYKIETRKFAQEWLGLAISKDVKGSSAGMEDKIKALSALMDEAWHYSTVTSYFPLISRRRILGRFIVFAKKVARKFIHVFLRWYIDPIMNRQSIFNKQMIELAQRSREIFESQQQTLQDLQEQIHLSNRRQTEEIETLKQFSKNLQDQMHVFNLQTAEAQRQSSQNIQEQMSAIHIEITNANQFIDYIRAKMNLSADLELLNDSSIDYMDFENTFRGSRDDIKAAQKYYLPYYELRGGGEVLDIGCGRGEFLEIMFDNNIPAYGIDVYPPFVDFCKQRGFRVFEADALTYLHSLSDCSLGGIFMSQVAEHLQSDYMIALIKTAYLKLKPGCHFIIETPNPEALITYRDFYIDFGHMKPVHYHAMEYLLKSAHFQHVERYNPPRSDRRIHLLNNERDISILNDFIFSYMDYGVIARK
jgi:O-antigen chain-terminating methyltransferase